MKEKKVLHLSLSVSQDRDIDENKIKAMDTSLSNLKKLREAENGSYSELNEKLWSKEHPLLRKGCSRELLGWIVNGGYSYRKGCEIGEGLITLRGLLCWKQCFNKMSESFVFVREPSSLQYRRATMKVIC